MNEKDILRKANRLFIVVDDSVSDEDKMTFYNLLQVVLPEMEDTCSVVLDLLIKVIKNRLTLEQYQAVMYYFFPYTYNSKCTYTILADMFGTSEYKARKLIKDSISVLRNSKSEFFISAMKEEKEKEYKLYLNHYSIFDLGLSIRAENLLFRARIDSTDLATMTEDEICKIKMIGPKIAKEIIDKRDKFFGNN